MGEIAEMMLDGMLCEGCGVYLGDSVGHVRYCGSCKHDKKKERLITAHASSVRKDSRGRTIMNCKHCGKIIKVDGLFDHLRAKHPEHAPTPGKAK